MLKEPQFNQLSSWQKEDCLFCKNKATRQVGYKIASIRCCDETECGEKAKWLAEDLGDIKTIESSSETTPEYPGKLIL
jgi:hypothetical protein